MTEIGKETLTLIRAAIRALGLVLALVFAFPALGQDLPVVVDPLTGVAMSGYDPVSYFDAGGPTLGTPAYSAEWQGATWYFATAANRAAFVEAPTVYAPQFGGYCTTALGRGYLSSGNPAYYAIHGDALFLFYSVGNRAAFNASIMASTQRAAENWLEMAPRLTPRLELAGAVAAAAP